MPDQGLWILCVFRANCPKYMFINFKMVKTIYLGLMEKLLFETSTMLRVNISNRESSQGRQLFCSLYSCWLHRKSIWTLWVLEVLFPESNWLVNTRGTPNCPSPAQKEPLQCLGEDKAPVVRLGKAVWIIPHLWKGKQLWDCLHSMTWVYMVNNAEAFGDPVPAFWRIFFLGKK